MTDKNVIEIAQATDIEVRALLASILDEFRKRKIDLSLTRTLIGEDFELVVSVSDSYRGVQIKWLHEIDEYEDLEEEEDVDSVDGDGGISIKDEDEDFYGDDDWIYDESMSGRTPNDDRSDSMNPNSHRYNPGK